MRVILRSAVLVGLIALLASCAEEGTPSADGSSTSTPATTENAAESSSAPAGAGECPVGSYQVASITAKESVTVGGEQLSAADVQGLTLEFTADGTWELTGDDATITVTAAGLTADATLDGSAAGRYAETGGEYTFSQDSADGQITLDQPVAGIDSIPMDEFGPAVAPSGTATLTCSDTGLTVDAENAVLELTGAGAEPPATDAEPPTDVAPPTGAEPPTGGAPMVINATAQTKSYTCSGEAVTINGSANNFTFAGGCEAVIINGSTNKITVSAEVITLNGSHNQIAWTGTKPRVNDNGVGNNVGQG